MTEELEKAAAVQQKIAGMHIFYYSHVLESYIENAIEFIEQGIREGDQVLFVENTRIYPMIRRKLEERLTAEEMEKFHYENNFDFYWKNRNFHPQTILSHFADLSAELNQKEGSLRTWGHIEWGDQQDIEHELETYETALEELVFESKGISVCAYDASRVSDELKEKLMILHNFHMTDEKKAFLLINR